MVTLEACRLFRPLTPSELAALHRIAREKSFSAGREIFKQGDAGDGIYMVKDGLVEISAAATQNSRSVLSQVGSGEIFGEMAVLETKPRSATAAAASDSVVYFIPRDPLLAMIAQSPAFALELLREISRRLREFDQRHVQEILQAERLAVIGRFARAIVHDLKNPLNIIGLTAEIAAAQNATPETRQKSAATIRKQVDRISELVGDILDFTQGTRAEIIFAAMDYRLFVQQVLEEIRPEIELQDSRLEVEGPMPLVKLPLDPKRLRRVFYNLLHNATDAMPHGGRIIVRFRPGENEFVTEIEDTGTGIAPEIIGKLFQPFATFGKQHGTGLGLSICKKIIEDHRGRIGARNEPGRGAIFSFTLPLTQ
jgi:signal transduction histidine kinase